jgi:hypothetical protein
LIAGFSAGFAGAEGNDQRRARAGVAAEAAPAACVADRGAVDAGAGSCGARFNTRAPLPCKASTTGLLLAEADGVALPMRWVSPVGSGPQIRPSASRKLPARP